jgi:predicted RNA-binding Zn-ribbon protein involved in translation (DUF1610 family)
VGAAADAALVVPACGANVESRLVSFFEPQCGHGVPRQSADRTSSSKLWPQAAQSNS